MLEYMISNVVCSLWGCPYIECCLDLQGVSEGFLLVLCRRVMEKNESCVGKFTATYSKFWKIGLWTFAGVHGHLWLACGTCLVTLRENSKLVRLLVKGQAQQVISLPWISLIWVVSQIMLIFLWLPDWDQLIGSILLGPESMDISISKDHSTTITHLLLQLSSIRIFYNAIFLTQNPLLEGALLL